MNALWVYEELAAPSEPADGRPLGPERLGEQVVRTDVLDAVGRAHGAAAPVTQGTLVTVTDGSKSRRALSRRAVWL